MRMTSEGSAAGRAKISKYEGMRRPPGVRKRDAAPRVKSNTASSIGYATVRIGGQIGHSARDA